MKSAEHLLISLPHNKGSNYTKNMFAVPNVSDREKNYAEERGREREMQNKGNIRSLFLWPL